MAEDTANPEEPSFDDTVADLANVLDDNYMIGADTELEAPTKSETTEEPKEKEQESDDDYLADIDEDEVADDDTPEETSEAEEEEDSDEGDKTVLWQDDDGKDITKEEAKKGYLRQSDYTKKTQELAETRKETEEAAKVVKWVKETQESASLRQEIEIAERVLATGIHYTPEGEPVTLNQTQLENTRKSVDEAKSQLSAVVPPRLDVLQEKVPELFSQDASVRQPVIDNLEAVYGDFGFIKEEINATNDPRILLMLKEIADGRELATKVEKAKARKQKGNTGVVSKSTVDAKKAPPTKKTRQSKTDSMAALDKAVEGDMESLGDAFIDLV